MIIDILLGVIFITLFIFLVMGMLLNLQKDTPIMDKVKRNKYARYYINLFGE